MRFAVLVISVAMIGSAGCGDDDGPGGMDAGFDPDSAVPDAAVPPDSAVPPDGAVVNDCPSVGDLTPSELAPGQCEISGVLRMDGTLTNDVQWFLEGRLQVGDEATQAVLTIDAGTDVFGDAEGEVDHLVVMPGSTLDALGTGAAPVRFLSDDADFDGSGEWGGVFLRGYEGLPTLTGTQGASRLDYVVVSEAGAPVEVTVDGESNTYQDNLVLNGVDQTTTLTFVQSHRSARDGLHILNGNPRLSWILVTAAARDGIWYRDFRGLIKDLMVIHDRDPDGSTGRSGIYASETADGDSNPRIVNATLVGRDMSSESGLADDSASEFGILFADNSDQIRLGNVVIANFRNGCVEIDEGSDLSAVDTDAPGPTYLDGVHCAHEAGGNPDLIVVRDENVGLPDLTVAPTDSINANGLVPYDGAAMTFTGEFAERAFTAGWYLANIDGIENGLAADSTSLNAFLDGDTNQDGSVDGDDVGAPFLIADDGPDGFNQDVAEDTGGYDLTHIGAVRSGSATAMNNRQFDNWTVATAAGEGFAVPVNAALQGTSDCPESMGGATVRALDRRAGRNVCEVSGVMTSDATITSDIEWELEGRFQVGNMATTPTLTIESGARIRGDLEDATDYLLVWPGATIDARGTGARPVRFSSDDAGIDGPGEWGGVFLRGFGGLPTMTGTEGASRLDYVVVAEAGAPVSVTLDGVTAMYQDGVVLNGVDRNTTLTFVQSHDSARDGFHILNSDARLSWILATGSVRDGVWYRNFTGLIKDLMVIHRPESGRSGIYASETIAGDSNPRIVNATLVGNDDAAVAAGADASAGEFGILFADNSDQVRLANVLIANFRNGCIEADEGANLSAIGTTAPAMSYLDGVHCAHEAGALPGMFAITRPGAMGLPAGSVAAPNSNGEGLVYYNGASSDPLPLPGAVETFVTEAGGINFTGEIAPRGNFFTAGWYLQNIRGVGNGLIGNADFLSAFLDGDTNRSGDVDEDDNGSPFIVADDGDGGFNQDVASDTGGYDLTHIGAVRGGAISNRQFDRWTVATSRSTPFTLQQVAAP
ncbi:MAG: hypothetical protein AAGE52_16400 [Myxococcota bacterium]